jgi:hypothetical protein
MVLGIECVMMLVIELRKIVFLKDVGLVLREEVLIVILI